ncbi:MAG TPA: hypothetical protein VFS42_06385 [Burkholderiaceae bacterium]|nr:hypothetical protein [Burkholderiaceae bacterium]
MQMERVQQELQAVQQHIKRAAQACQASGNVPSDLKSAIQQLDQQSNQVQQVMQSGDENQILQCVDELEEISDRAQHACERSDGLDTQLQACVEQAHEKLSSLKHQLH